MTIETRFGVRAPAWLCGHYFRPEYVKGSGNCEACNKKIWRDANPNTECANCGHGTYKSATRLREAAHVFCSLSCRSSFYNPATYAKCKQCNKKFKKNERAQVFCNARCWKASISPTPNVECRYCHKMFYRSPSYRAKYRDYYCNRTCYGRAQEKAQVPNTKCAWCDKPIFRYPSRLKLKQRNYCSRAHQNLGKTKLYAGQPKPHMGESYDRPRAA